MVDYTEKDIDRLVQDGAIFICNHSGGKDSQAMYLWLTTVHEIPHEQIFVVHADLPGVDWDGIIDHIESTIEHELHVTRANKTFEEMVRHRQKFPAPKWRQCTSDLKRSPIEKLVRQISKENNRPLIVNCMGLRAQESSARAKKKSWSLNNRNSKAGRQWYDWLPIFKLSEWEVFKLIEVSGQKPFWTYAEGMKRVSCRFCIMACKSDIKTAAKLAPEAFQKMVDLEKEIGFTMFDGETLEQRIKNKGVYNSNH